VERKKTMKTMKPMNWLCVMAMSVAVGGCAVDDAEDVTTDVAEQGLTQADVWHGTWNGGSANAQFWSPTGSGYLDVFENGSGQNRTAYLSFSTWSFDPTSEQCFTWTDWLGSDYTYCYYTRFTYAYGWGQIPAGDAQLSPNHAHVKTTLSSSFGGYQCTVDYTTWPWTCGAPTGGTIDVRWNKNGQSSYFNSGTSQGSYGAYTFKTQGTYRSSSANATGNVLETSFTDSWGAFGNTRGTSVTKSVQRTPSP